MDGIHRYVIKQFHISDFLYFLSRFCVYSYGIVFMLHSAVSFPNRLDAILRFGIGIFGIIGALCDPIYNIRAVRVGRFFKWYAGLLVISLIAGIYSPNIRWTDFTKNIFDILFLGTGFSFAVNSEERIKRFLRGFMCCGGIIFLFLFTHNLLHVDDRLGRSLTGDNTNTFALFILLTLIAAVGAFYLTNNRIVRCFCIVLTILDLYMLILSGGRKYLLAPIIIIAVLVIFNTSDRNSQIKRLFFSILLFIGIILGWRIITENPLFYSTIGYRFIERTSMQGREDYIIRGLQFFIDSPIWGHGENSFASLISSYTGYQIYSHNNYIEMLTNFGLIGFVWYYYHFIHVLKADYKDYKFTANKLCLFFVAVLCSLLFLDIGTVSYCDSSLVFVYWVMAFNMETIMRKHSSNEVVYE